MILKIYKMQVCSFTAHGCPKYNQTSAGRKSYIFYSQNIYGVGKWIPRKYDLKLDEIFSKAVSYFPFQCMGRFIFHHKGWKCKQQKCWKKIPTFQSSLPVTHFKWLCPEAIASTF